MVAKQSWFLVQISHVLSDGIPATPDRMRRGHLIGIKRGTSKEDVAKKLGLARDDNAPRYVWVSAVDLKRLARGTSKVAITGYTISEVEVLDKPITPSHQKY
jgi:hypothetical protein